MKKLLLISLLAVSLSLCACGSTAPVSGEEAVVNETADADSDDEAAVSDEATVEAVTVETVTAEEVSQEAEPAEEEVEEPVEEEAAIDDGLSEDVDRSKIVLWDAEKTMYVQNSVNVRKGPSKDFERVDNYKVNTEVTVLGTYEKNGWYLIKYGDAQAFISNNYLGDEAVDLEARKAAEEAAALAAIQQQQQQAAAQPAQPAAQPAPQPETPPAPVVVAAPAGILFIGDSRCVQMQEAVGGGNSSWVAENSKGYDWFSTKGLERAEPSIGKGTKVVICLGVNDTRNASKYAELINAKAAEWAARGAKTYFVSVNPVWENPYVTEEQVQNFNGTIVGLLSGVRWIDTHSFLEASGYRLVDGLHYDGDTYVKIFNAIVGSL